MDINKIIKEEFNEVKIHNISYNEDFIYEIGKNFYPKLKVMDNRFFVNYPKNKGSYSLNGFIRTLLDDTTDYLFSELKIKIKDIQKSNTTNSIYFNIGSANFRISDHKKRSFDGNDITFTLHTDIDKLIQKIYGYL